MSNIIKGKLEAFSEQGTEGVHWSMFEDGKQGYDGLHCFDQGDWLRITDPEGAVLWQGNLFLEYESNKKPFPFNPQYSQQWVAGMFVHGLPEHVDAETWAKWFRQQLTVELIKSNLPKFYPVKSSMISAYAWIRGADGAFDTMLVKFKDSSIYQYNNVPATAFDQFYAAESKGQYFIANVKNKCVSEKIVFPKPEGEVMPKHVPELVDIPEIDEYDNYLEWSPQDEEEFLKILDEDNEFKGM